MVLFFSSLIVVLIPFVFKYFHTKNKKPIPSNEIRQPRICLYTAIVGLFIMNIFLPSLCLLELDPSMNWYQSLAVMSILIIPADVLYIYLLLLAVNWKILVFDDCVEYYNIF